MPLDISKIEEFGEGMISDLIASGILAVGATLDFPYVSTFFSKKIYFVLDIPTLRTRGVVPLTFYINPSNFQISRKPATGKIQTMGADVIFHWGETPAIISCSGNIGLFYNPVTGVVDALRPLTKTYEFLMDLLSLYRNNGIVYDKRGQPIAWHPITLWYEDKYFYGYFDSFNYTDNATDPYTLSYDFTFVSLHEVYINLQNFIYSQIHSSGRG